jgi:predicted regulator of Ras-like GTPase activity (Roadblock/LC7/MglB family)
MRPDDAEQLSSVLVEYHKLSGANASFLFDRQGRTVARAGTPSSLDESTLGGLVAGSFAATEAMARVLRETKFSLMSHGGEREHLNLSLVADRYMLATAFDDRTTIGMIRLYDPEAVRKLRRILDDDDGAAGVPARLPPRPLGPGEARAERRDGDAP